MVSFHANFWRTEAWLCPILPLRGHSVSYILLISILFVGPLKENKEEAQVNLCLVRETKSNTVTDGGKPSPHPTFLPLLVDATLGSGFSHSLLGFLLWPFSSRSPTLITIMVWSRLKQRVHKNHFVGFHIDLPLERFSRGGVLWPSKQSMPSSCRGHPTQDLFRLV